MEWSLISRKTLLVLGLLSLLVVGGALLAKEQTSKHPGAPRQFARLVAVYELTKHHATELEGREEMVPVKNELWEHLRVQGDVGLEWTSRFIPRAKVSRQVPAEPKRHGALTEFEKHAMQRLSEGSDEVFDALDDGGFQFARTVRAERSCVAVCHGPAPDSTSKISVFQPGDLMGTQIVEARRRPR